MPNRLATARRVVGTKPVSYTHLDVYKRQVEGQEEEPPAEDGVEAEEVELVSG